MRLLLLLIFSANFFYFSSYGQADSTFTDTVVIIKDPLIIRQEVIIWKDSEKEKKKFPPIIMGLNLSLGKLEANPDPSEIEFSSTLYKSFGLSVGYNFRNIVVSAGIGGFNTTLLHKSSIHEQIIDYETKIEDSVIATYYVDGKKYTVTEPDTNIYQYTRSVSYAKECVSNVNYIQFPLTFGYKIKLRNSRFALVPCIQIIFNKRTRPTEDNEFDQKIASVFYGIDFKIEYSVSPDLILSVNTSLQHQYGSIYKNLMKENWILKGFGLGLNYRI